MSLGVYDAASGMVVSSTTRGAILVAIISDSNVVMSNSIATSDESWGLSQR
jgi:hypothetical protein